MHVDGKFHCLPYWLIFQSPHEIQFQPQHSTLSVYDDFTIFLFLIVSAFLTCLKPSLTEFCVCAVSLPTYSPYHSPQV